MKIDELIKEIQDLKEKERQLEYLKKDKKKMADKLLEYELKEYNKNEYIDIANYFDDWGELLDVVENLLKRLKEKGE